MYTKRYSSDLGEKAVDDLHRQALASQVSNTKIGKMLGIDRRTVGKRWKQASMPLSDFIYLSNVLGLNPAKVIDQATQKCKETRWADKA